MNKRLLKFDIVHPTAYLEKKKSQWNDLDQLSAAEYRQRLISLRSNYSDFYTHYLNELGWEAEEFFLLDNTYLDKLGKELFGWRYPFRKINNKLWGKIRPARWGWKQRVVQAYIKEFQPDVLFARSQPMASRYWQQFRHDCLLVARLSAKLPNRWHPQDWDLIYTDIESFKDFFEAHNVSTELNKQGFDPRILDELEGRPPKHDVTFVGGMGTQNFSKRTHFFEQIAGEVNFKWWGYWWKYGGEGSLDDFPNLKKFFQGPTSGLDMYQIYKDSKIVLNDYVDIDINDSIGYNQRMFEVMGVGAFMLTRDANNFKEQFPDDIFATFNNAEDCVSKIEHHLKHDEERKKIGRNAQNFVLNNYNYQDIIKKFDKDLRKHLTLKREDQ
jgi:glycosyltransferase involved in cell wall biosynthesis